jgi:hypothetical protein
MSMRLLARASLPFVLAGAFYMLPFVASAQVPGELPFGGYISVIFPCANDTIYTIVISARNTDPLVPGPYSYSVGTMTDIVPPIPGVPPTYPGQQILGTYDYPWVCYIPPYTFLWSMRMQTEGVSLI